MSEHKLIVRENYGSSSVTKSYLRDGHGRLEVVDNTRRLTSVSQFFRSVFLPQGYPESVSDDYLQYQTWDTLQAFCSSITGSLATQAMLKGVGVGDENATVLAATMTWILKDGTGMIGRIVFAWMQGTYLDCDCKRWRLFADILNDCAIFLEILAPFFQLYFTFLVCVAGVAKSIVGVAGGATRAALTQHQARRNNMADVSAKDGSQETLVNLAGLLCNLALIPLVTGNQMMIWTLFLIFTFIHLFANYRAVTCVTMETFNMARLHLVVEKYCKGDTSHSSLMVKSINALEPVIFKTKRILSIRLGSSLDHLINSYDELEKLTDIYRSAKYILHVNHKRGSIDICLHLEATSDDQLQACYQAEILEYALKAASQPNYEVTTYDPSFQNIIEAAKDNDTLSMVSLSYKYAEVTIPGFLEQVRGHGWVTQPVLLCADEWRAEWDLAQGYNLSKKMY